MQQDILNKKSGHDQKVYEKLDEIKTKSNRPYYQKLKDQGKLFVRDKIKYLVDEDSIEIEDGVFARENDEQFLPGDAVVTLIAKINGRKVAIIANDLTVKAGTWGVKTIEKIMRMQELAEKRMIPLIYMIDSAGARLNEQFDTFIDRRHAGKIFYNTARISGNVPQISLVFGASPAGSAYLPALCDFVVMVDKNASVYLGSPRMAEMATGEKVSMEEMGGARMHNQISGLGDMLVKTEQEALDATKRYLEFMPQNWKETVPLSESIDPLPGKNIEEIVPANQRVPMDMYAVIDRIVDADSFFEFKQLYAKELITGFCRIGGRAVGIVANQSKVKGGVLFPESAEKAAHFVSLCDAYNVPLLFLVDLPGFMVGSKVEKEAIIRRGARMLSTVANATVPRISVIVRKAYGAGYVVMSGASMQPDACIALPQAQPAVMGPEAAVNAMYFNKIQSIEDPEERQKYIIEQREKYNKDINVWSPASQLFIDDVVPGDRLRNDLINRFELYSENRDTLEGIADKKTVVRRG
ncbi:putative propionyl-CoA carboxylase beta chain 5 [Oceanobacillus oncorhynchi]|uniref:Putative propionyl-CoA carboxylase beta chain 5 n=1 Tax=Oceanobacillus oncorhynchi TaxID=545501 RepID=A0A0A1MBA2_9BACI|nr:acyl-CoA carboxylase subunit beta [Oceanobacillus oncorhynchi]CEI82635.1 putative propionyl-CoA carboxylase beta chain 5 [Oceanobacillus oncorhynchi]